MRTRPMCTSASPMYRRTQLRMCDKTHDMRTHARSRAACIHRFSYDEFASFACWVWVISNIHSFIFCLISRAIDIHTVSVRQTYANTFEKKENFEWQRHCRQTQSYCSHQIFGSAFNSIMFLANELGAKLLKRHL